MLCSLLTNILYNLVTILNIETKKLEKSEYDYDMRDETIQYFTAAEFHDYAIRYNLNEELKFFEKKLIKAGESIVYRFEIDPLRDLGFINKKGDRYLDKGEYNE